MREGSLKAGLELRQEIPILVNGKKAAVFLF
jgi:hypothetical protein